MIRAWDCSMGEPGGEYRDCWCRVLGDTEAEVREVAEAFQRTAISGREAFMRSDGVVITREQDFMYDRNDWRAFVRFALGDKPGPVHARAKDDGMVRFMPLPQIKA